MDVKDIVAILRLHGQTLRRDFAVRRIGVFGSFAKGTESKKSDIDFYVEFELSELDLDKYLRLIEYLEKLFNKKIDLVTKDGVESIRIPHIKEEIKKEIVYA